MSTLGIVLLVIAIVLLVAMVVLFFLGKRAEKKKEEQDAQIAAAAQTVTMLIIDKKRMPAKDSGLPQMVIDQIPKVMRRSKLPIVKAKVGPKIMSLVCEDSIFDLVPLKKEVKAEVRGSLEAPKKKQGFWKRMRAKAENAYAEQTKQDKKSKKK